MCDDVASCASAVFLQVSRRMFTLTPGPRMRKDDCEKVIMPHTLMFEVLK